MKFITSAIVAIVFILTLPLSAFGLPVITETIYTDWTFNSGLLYGFDGDGHTYDYASYIDFADNNYNLPDWATGTYIGTRSDIPRNLTYGHTLPGDLSVPPDEIVSAKLWIDGWLINDDDNVVKIESSLLQWDPLNDWSFLSLGDNTLYDLTDVTLTDFWNNSPLDVLIHSNERVLRIDRSILMMDYNNAPVPEPTTIVIVGLGLLGAGITQRRKNS